MFRNKLLKEYSRKQLEELFIQICETLDDRANDIYKLEKQISERKRKQKIIKEQAEADDKRDVEFTGKQVPDVNTSVKNEIEKCLYDIDMLDLDLRREEVKKNQVLRELNYIRSYFVFPNKKYKAGDIYTHSTIQLKNDLMEILQKAFRKCEEWQRKNRCLACLNILKIDFDSAISFFKDISPDQEELMFKEKEIRDELSNVEHDIILLTKERDEQKAKNKALKKKVYDLEDEYNAMVEKERDKYLEKTALETQIQKKEKQLSTLDELRKEIEKLNKEINNLKSLIADREMFLMREFGIESINGKNKLMDMETENYALKQFVERMRQTNIENQKKVSDKEEKYKQQKEVFDALEGNLKVLREEYSNIRNMYYELVASTSPDPFQKVPFQVFIDELATERIKLQSLQVIIEENERVQKKNDLLRKKILMKNKTEKEIIRDLNEMVFKERRRYEEFDNKLKVNTQKNFILYEGQNGFILTFNEFAFSGMKNEDVILHIQFIDQIVESPVIKVGTPDVEFSCLIPCEKEGIITTIITQNIYVTLTKISGEELGKGKIDITPLVDADEIVTSIEIYNSRNRLVAATSLHVSIAEPLY